MRSFGSKMCYFPTHALCTALQLDGDAHMDQFKRISDVLGLHRLKQRLSEASGLRDYAPLLHDIEITLPIPRTVPDFPLFSVLPTTFEPREAWSELLSAYSLDDDHSRRLLRAGFSLLDRESVAFSVVGDPFPTSVESRHLLIDQDYATVLLPPADGRRRNLFLAIRTLQHYRPHYPILDRESSAIFSLGAIRGHIGYHGALSGNYFEPIELTVSSRTELDDLVTRLRENLAHRPDLELWFRGQPTEYFSEDLTDLASSGICPWRSLRDPSLAPSLCRRLAGLWGQWGEYAAILLELAHSSIFLEEDLDIPAYKVRRLGTPALNSLGDEFDGITPELVGEWPGKGEAHHYETTFRALQKMFFFQHYGLPSTVLDVTHDLDVALFFANHRIENHQYVRVGPDPARMLYIIILQMGLDQFLDSRQISEHYGLLRPLRQQCGLIAGASMINRNAYARFVSIRVHLKGEIEQADLTSDYLFPSPDEDAFLHRLLEFQKEHRIDRAKAFVLTRS